MAETVDLAALRKLVEKWRVEARTDAIGGVAQAMKSGREYFGRVNAAFTFQQCADELAAILPAVQETP